VGKNPTAVSVNPSTNTVYVANYNDSTVSVIDGKTNTVTDVIYGSRLPNTGLQVGNYPFAISVNPLTNIAYVANLDGIPIVDTSVFV
jgi:YVTN family beta-propeller protein